MLHQYRVTKYDPALRNASGAYQREDWTSHLDIGKLFAGEVLTEERYLQVEEAYLVAATMFLSEAGIQSLRVISLENTYKDPDAPENGSVVQDTQIKAVLRALLRERYWCKLESSSAFIHVGYDYYMYIGVPCACSRAEKRSTELGLFTERFRSPYLADAA